MNDIMSDLDYAHYLLGDIDLDAQLLAIDNLLARNRAADDSLADDIRELAEAAKNPGNTPSWRIDDLWVDHLYNSVYQGAAHSMAAAGMLAPLLETVFSRLFAAIGAQDWPMASSARRDRAGGQAEDFWNPQIYFSRRDEPRPDLILGIPQLATETGLAAELPADFKAVVKALFSYRNQMFHNGFEWPEAKRASFDKMIETEGWPADWFSRSTSGGATWIIYMSDAFTQRCLAFIHEALEAAGRFARRNFDAFGFAMDPEAARTDGASDVPDWLAEALTGPAPPQANSPRE